MLTRFVRRQFINNKQFYRGLSYYNNDNKNNDLSKNEINNGHISAEEYLKDTKYDNPKYDIIRAKLNKIDDKVEWLMVMVFPSCFVTIAQAIYTLLH